ncbi:MAG: hypothetical protein WBQ94_03050 [Terracidiphilus sp.]
MWTLILLGLFTVMSASAGAAERVTVDQLEQRLFALMAAPRAAAFSPGEVIGETNLLDEMNQDLGKFGLDSDQAAQLRALELTERLTGNTLALWTAKYKPGPQIRHALELVADRSALLDPPAGELPSPSPPDADSQRKMIEAGRIYVTRVLSHLPNFFATRTTERFDDGPITANGVILASVPGLRLVGRISREITFRDGSEVIDPMEHERAMPGVPDAGLTTSGEFGPEAAMALVDLAEGSYTFHHWEQTLAGLAAVYRYSVPRQSSHYQVNYSCQVSVTFHDTPGYHGSLAIDPASGAILRFTLEVDSKKGDPISHIASAIEYGKVVIGDRRYICPLRSLAFMVQEANACVHNAPKERLLQPVTMLNRTTFTDFHRLGSSTRIISEPTATPDPAPTIPNP